MSSLSVTWRKSHNPTERTNSHPGKAVNGAGHKSDHPNVFHERYVNHLLKCKAQIEGRRFPGMDTAKGAAPERPAQQHGVDLHAHANEARPVPEHMPAMLTPVKPHPNFINLQAKTQPVEPEQVRIFDPDDITAITELGGMVMAPSRRPVAIRSPFSHEQSMPVTVLLFDMLNVLYETRGRPPFVPDNVRAALVDAGMSKDGYGDPKIIDACIQAQRQLRSHHGSEFFQRGGPEIPRWMWMAHHEIVANLLGIHHPMIAEMFERQAESKQIPLRPRSNVHEILDELKSRGYRLGILSNSFKSYRAQLKQDSLLDYFDTVMFSFELEAWKPDPQAFIRAAAKIGLPPSSIAYVGSGGESEIAALQRVQMMSVALPGQGQSQNSTPVRGLKISHLGELLEYYKGISGDFISPHQ